MEQTIRSILSRRKTTKRGPWIKSLMRKYSMTRRFAIIEKCTSCKTISKMQALYDLYYSMNAFSACDKVRMDMMRERIKNKCTCQG